MKELIFVDEKQFETELRITKDNEGGLVNFFMGDIGSSFFTVSLQKEDVREIIKILQQYIKE